MITSDEIIIPAPNGGSIRCGKGEEYEYGGTLRLCDGSGNEIMLWEAQEWADDPEQVIGAIFHAACKPLGELLRIWKRNRLRDGIWETAPLTDIGDDVFGQFDFGKYPVEDADGWESSSDEPNVIWRTVYLANPVYNLPSIKGTFKLTFGDTQVVAEHVQEENAEVYYYADL
jgi:hypothetical protein